jgi:cytoskeleton protein RodZ
MADIGATLRDARMRAKIDINEVETSTKIRAKYLRAIENEEWALLPGDVYVKSFLRTYGDYLGLDSRQLIDDYKRRYERPSDHELRPIMPPGRERDRQSRGPRGPLIPPWALIGVVLVGVVVALYFLGRNKGGTPTTSTGTHAITGRHRKAPAHHRASTTASVKPAPTTVRLQLIPTGDVYVCLVDGSGKRLIPGEIFNVGQTIPAKTSTKLMLTLGNASVKMKVNGASVPVPSTGSPVGFELLPSGHTMLPAAKQPQCT